MDEINVGDFVRIINNEFVYAYPKDGEAYYVKYVRTQADERNPLYEVAVPNALDEDTVPYWGWELEVVRVTDL